MSGVASGNQKTVAPVVDMAPDFDLPALIGGVKKRFHLRDRLVNRNLVLAFYPANWDSVSTKQLAAYQAEQTQISLHKAELVSICTDSIMNTTAWEREIGPFEFPMCSDFWPHGAVSQAYGVFREHEPFAGGSERAVFIVQPTGRIAFRKIYDVNELPPVSETLDALRGL